VAVDYFKVLPQNLLLGTQGKHRHFSQDTWRQFCESNSGPRRYEQKCEPLYHDIRSLGCP